MALSRPLTRLAAFAALALICSAGFALSTASAATTVDANSPAQTLSPAQTSVTVPVTISRDDGTPMIGYHVRVSVSSELAVSGGTAGITQGTFLSAGGRPTSYQVLDYGDGNYVVDGVVLGTTNCRTETSGTLFNLLLTRKDGTVLIGPGTVTIVSDTLRDCSNALITSSPGTSATVNIDFQAPTVAVTSPNGGENWTAGSSHAITWTATDGSGVDAAGVDLEFSSNDGGSWNSIAAGQSNAGTYAWTVPSIATALARVRVTARDVYGNSASDASNAAFTITVSTSTSLTASPNPSVIGQSVALIATVSPSAAPGSVEFFDGLTSLGSVAVSGGTAELDLTTLAIGNHSLTATFTSSGSYSSSTSSAVPFEVKAQIVATAGANGTIAPPGTTTYSLNASVTYTMTPASGYHVGTLTVDGSGQPVTPGVMTYPFNSINANHTIDVTFAANPAVTPISALAAVQVKTGGDADGTTRIRVSWPDVPAGSTVEVFRVAYGNYPEYDDPPGGNGVPSAPSYVPSAPWSPVTLSSLASSAGVTSGTDESASRDFYYYAAFVTDGYGSVSTSSNIAGGTLNYFLGDVAGGASLGDGDNEVDIQDISLLGAHYGITGAAVDAVAYLDVGPTTDFSVDARPTTDDRVDFEDLVMFALTYGTTQGPPTSAQPVVELASGPSRISLEVPAGGDATLPVRVRLSGAGDAHAISVRLTWNAAVVQPTGVSAGDLLVRQHGVVMSPAAGSFDAALLGGHRQGLAGEGVLATVTFQRRGTGDPGIEIDRVVARDGANQPVSIERGVHAMVVPTVTAFAGALPNPFRSSTALAFSLAAGGPVELSMYSVDGRRVRTLVHEMRDAGEYRVTWDGLDGNGHRAAPGIYFAHLATPQGQFVRRTVRIE